jgi:hypothetical protein
VPKAALSPCLPPGARRSTAEPSRRYRITEQAGTYQVVVDDGWLADSRTLRGIVDALEGDIALHVAAMAPHHVFIHAGVVKYRGRALLIPGRSLAGKSTLVARLIAQGATYYSDEYAVLDEDGRVLPYARPMSLRRSTGRPRRVLPKRRGRRAVPVGWVLALTYRKGTAMSAEAVRGGRLALVLMDNAVAARLAPRRILPVLRSAVAEATGKIGERGEATAAARQILMDCLLGNAVLGGQSLGKGKSS